MVKKSYKLNLIFMIFILLIGFYFYNSFDLLRYSIHEREPNNFDNKLSDGLLPTADFIVDANSIFECMDVHFTFTGIDGDPPMTYIWDFGDMSPKLSGKNPTHSYKSYGVYSVNLTVIDGDGDTDSEVKEDYIIVEPVPLTVDFRANATTVDEGEVIRFTFTGDSLYPPTEFLWNFGDGTTSTSKNPTHHYTYAGTFTVSLRVKETSLDRSETKTKVDYIHVMEREEEGAVSGYNLLIIISLTGVVLIILIYRKAINKKKGED
ncbi:MAG: PKD domain-containing protein [Candidatus Thorarchaeota archaeon]